MMFLLERPRAAHHHQAQAHAASHAAAGSRDGALSNRLLSAGKWQGLLPAGPLVEAGSA
eukprot:SAG25_NODE_10089_length_346_cov_0.688259_1_plen_58_part_10